MKLHDLKNITGEFSKTDTLPVLFVGHGNPMNAIEDNVFSRTWETIGRQLPVPTAILSISAHWLTRGTKVTAMEQPTTIHDFGGFPEALYQQIYPAPGAPALAEQTQKMLQQYHVMLDFDWGFDHGTWSVLKKMFPEATIPVYQLSIDYSKPMEYHYRLAQELKELRRKGVLIIGSGNIVHNLRSIRFGSSTPYDWAVDFDEKISNWIQERDHPSIIGFQNLGALATLAHPTYDHFLPLMYVLGLQEKSDNPVFFNTEFDMSSVSMRSVIFQKS